MVKNENNVVNLQDPFGTVRFAEIKAKFGDPAKLNKLFKGRFETTVSVFAHRTSLAHDLHRANDGYRWERANAEHRLAQYKSVDFFLGAMQALLDEKLKHDAIPVVKKRRYPAW